MKSSFRIIACLALVLSLAPSLSATTAIELSNREMTETSDVIVTGRAIGIQADWVGRSLVTFVTIEVTDTLKGDAGRTLTLALPGGVDVNREVPIAVTYAGAPRINIDENVFLFLTDATADFGNAYTVAGFSQGKFSIVDSPEGAQLVKRDLSELNLQHDPAQLVRKGAMSSGSLAAFRAEIESYLPAASGTQR